MKLHCKNCEAEIPVEDINLDSRICICKHCNEVFKIDEFLSNHQDAIKRIPKPDYSKVESFIAPDSMGLIIPPNGLKGTSIFFLIFACIWNAITWTMVGAFSQQDELGPMLLLIPFVIIGVATLGMFLYSWRGSFSILLDHHHCHAAWSIFGLKRKKSFDTSAIGEVLEEVIYTNNYQPVYGVSIHYSDKQSLRFGSVMTEDERKWCIGEIRHFLKLT